MIKRLNKITPLIIAVASIVNIMPVSVIAAEYERVSYEEGTINEAVSYKDGKFYIDGDIADGENEGIYYLSDKKYDSLEDLYVGSDVNIYGEKYLNINSNEYFLDLSTGKLVDEDIENDDLEDAKANLRKKTKNKAEDRYSDHYELKEDLEKLPSSKFVEDWYEAIFTSDVDGTDISVYTDKNGNYIDADYNVGKVKVTTENKIITLKDTEDIEEETSVSISDPTVLAHDQKYIYRKATMTVNSDEEIIKINGINVEGSNLFNPTEDKTSVSFNVIQKISKEQSSGSIDGAKYSNNVTNYFVGKKNGTKVGFMEGDGTKYSISKGKIIAHKISDGKITAQGISLKSENGTNFIGIKKADAETFVDYDLDVNGNLWIINGGFIYKYNTAQDWIKTYKVDGSMSNISVYDQNNLITWDEDSEIYSIINKVPVSENKTENAVNSENEISSNLPSTENESVDENLKFGWNKNDDGTWSFINSDSTYSKGWLNENSNWYYFNENGIMQTGWINQLDKWYYLREDGSMATGWIKVSDKWYYLNDDGSMAYNTVISGYSLSSDGAMI